VVDQYLSEHVRSGKVADPGRIEIALRNVMRGLPLGPDTRVSELGTDFGRVYTHKRQSGVILGREDRQTVRAQSPATARRELAALWAGLRWGARHGLVDRVPPVDLPPSSPPRDFYLTREEVDHLLSVAAAESEVYGRMTRVHRFLLLALGTAARGRSIETLLWGRVDFENKIIRFDLSADGKRTGRATKKRRVPVPIAGWLRPWLERAWREAESMYVLDNDRNIRPALSALCLRVAKGTGNERYLQVTRHVLRHTAATLMAQAGVSLFDLAGVLGDSVDTVTRVYAHHSPHALRGAVEVLGPGDCRTVSSGVG
jgi:integrase